MRRHGGSAAERRRRTGQRAGHRSADQRWIRSVFPRTGGAAGDVEFLQPQRDCRQHRQWFWSSLCCYNDLPWPDREFRVSCALRRKRFKIHFWEVTKVARFDGFRFLGVAGMMLLAPALLAQQTSGTGGAVLEVQVDKPIAKV